MNRKSDQTKKTVVAVPYYGALTLPPAGFSRVYFIVEVKTGSAEIDSVALKVWDPKKELNLSRWLKSLGVSGVICSDTESQYEVALHAEGIWVLWRQEGEVSEVVGRWARGEVADPSAFACGTPGNGWCRPSFEELSTALMELTVPLKRLRYGAA